MKITYNPLKLKIHERKKIFEDLNKLFINHYSVFPDFEGMKEQFDDYGSLYGINKRKNKIFINNKK